MKKTYFLFMVLVVIFFAMVILVIGSGSIFPSNPATSNPVFQADVNEPEAHESGAEASALIDKLPYSGQNFSMSYDFDNGIFYLYINPGNSSAGESELNAFLNQNGISSKSQVPGLQTSNTPLPTTAP